MVPQRVPHPLNANTTITRAYCLRLLRRLEGGCVSCTERRDPTSANFCTAHLVRHRARNRAALGCQRWVPGGPGRKPFDYVEPSA